MNAIMAGHRRRSAGRLGKTQVNHFTKTGVIAAGKLRGMYADFPRASDFSVTRKRLLSVSQFPAQGPSLREMNETEHLDTAQRFLSTDCRSGLGLAGGRFLSIYDNLGSRNHHAPLRTIGQRFIWRFILKIFLCARSHLPPKLNRLFNVRRSKRLTHLFYRLQIGVRLLAYGRRSLCELSKRAPKAGQKDRLHFDDPLKPLCLGRHLQPSQQFRIERVPRLCRSLVNLFVQVGRHSQCRSDVVVLRHDMQSTARLQNGIDTKMKPKHNKYRLHFEAEKDKT
jgi:hypothetical protein